MATSNTPLRKEFGACSANGGSAAACMFEGMVNSCPQPGASGTCPKGSCFDQGSGWCMAGGSDRMPDDKGKCAMPNFRPDAHGFCGAPFGASAGSSGGSILDKAKDALHHLEEKVEHLL